MAQKEYFPGIGKIKFEGKESKNPLAYRYYDAEKVIMGKKMKDWLKFAMAWWHTLCAEGGDQFGGGTKTFPWNQGADALTVAKQKADAGFEIMEKLGIEYFCFHDVDLISEGNSIEEYEANMKAIVAYIKEKMQATGIKNLWGTANVFGHERYMNGAATNPDFNVVARAAVQIKNAIDATIELGGSNYVFWGGREGYMSLLNTDMKREKEHLAQMLKAARDYARAKGFKGTFLIEPKPMEPTKHQYDVDTETVIGFLRAHGLEKDFKVNIEVNHATLAGHTFEHELACAVDAGMLGSIDANRGDYQNGWDTDQFPIDNYELIQAMMQIIRGGGPPQLHRLGRHLHRPHRRHGCHGTRLGERRRTVGEITYQTNGGRPLCQLRCRQGQGVRRRQAFARRHSGLRQDTRRTGPDQRQAGTLRGHREHVLLSPVRDFPANGRSTRMVALHHRAAVRAFFALTQRNA